MGMNNGAFRRAAAAERMRLAGSLTARAHQPGFEDMAIAATAQMHELTVLTRNVRHFEALGVHALEPFQDVPPLL